MTSAPASSAASRGGASPTCPIGVAARTTTPPPTSRAPAMPAILPRLPSPCLVRSSPPRSAITLRAREERPKHEVGGTYDGAHEPDRAAARAPARVPGRATFHLGSPLGMARSDRDGRPRGDPALLVARAAAPAGLRRDLLRQAGPVDARVRRRDARARGSRGA